MALNIQRHSWLAWVAAAVGMVLQDFRAWLSHGCVALVLLGQLARQWGLPGEGNQPTVWMLIDGLPIRYTEILFFILLFDRIEENILYSGTWSHGGGRGGCPQLVLDAVRHTWYAIGMFVACEPNGVPSSLLLPVPNILSGDWKALIWLSISCTSLTVLSNLNTRA